ncbi:MAG: hypothetical protein LBD92_04875 [Oscillospiraceae bacterium]|nr:hypothetical protein [Oscillospiraceae bacterium]
MSGELMFYCGLAAAGGAVIAGLVAAAALSFGWKKISVKLDAEYGKKRK